MMISALSQWMKSMAKLFVGGCRGGLFMVELDGSSEAAVILEEIYDIYVLAMTIDPELGNLYYLGETSPGTVPTMTMHLYNNLSRF